MNLASIEFGAAANASGSASDSSGAEFHPCLLYKTIATSGDNLSKVFNLPASTAVKIDIDGVKDLILGGLNTTLSSPVLYSVFIKALLVNTSQLNSLTTKLESDGFSLATSHTPSILNVKTFANQIWYRN